MGAKIRVIPAEAPPFEVDVENTATVGRTPDNTVCLNFSPHVSRQHAVIRCHNGYEYQLMDLGSRNGTYVNDQRVIMPVNLTDGSRIRIANNELIFMQETSGTVDSEAFAATLAASMDQSVGPPRNVAILVCDIRGFSTISESVPPDLLAPFLGQWFREAGNIVQQTNGIVDKFIGDAMLAYWPQSDQDPGAECLVSFNVGKKLLDLATKRRWPQMNLPFQIAVALHHGRVTFGNIGLVAQRDATIIGDAVNTAFRLEGIMKLLGQRLATSDSFAQVLPDRSELKDLGEKELKGKAQRVRVFGLD